MLRILIVALGFLLLMSGCVTVKPYQRVFLNDPEMQLTDTGGKTFENYVQSIREGAITAGGKKSSGGCGCN